MSRKLLVGVVVIGLWLGSCETGIEIDLTCWSKHTSEMFYVRGQILETVFGTEPWGIVNITWGWTVREPDGDSIIIERSLDDETAYTYLASVEIDTIMTYVDSDTAITYNRPIYYRLSYVEDGGIDQIKDIDLKTPHFTDIWCPGTDSLSIQNDTLVIRWGGTVYSNYTVDIFKAQPTQIESLINLVDPIFSEEVDTRAITIAGADTLFDTLTVYTIRVTGSKIVEFVTDTSIGFRSFIRLP